MVNKIHCANNLDIISNLENNSVDLYLFSPPYDNLRDYKNYTHDLNKIGREVSRTLKDGGICVMVIQDQTKNGRKTCTSFRTIVDWVDNTELDLWECCIYYRSGTPGAWWSKRFRVDHEYIPIFVKGKKPQVFNKSHMKEKTRKEYGGHRSSISVRLTDGKTQKNNKNYTLPDEKDQGTVIHYPNSSREHSISKENKRLKIQHPATFPEKLAADFIKAFTNEQMLVVDPYSGSGTTCVQAKKLNRNFIGIDISKEYCEIANQRLNLLDNDNNLIFK